jgi:hypothetical protein
MDCLTESQRFFKAKISGFSGRCPRKKNILGLDSDSPKHKKK